MTQNMEKAKYMTLNEYQQEAMKTAVYPNKGGNLVYPVLGLCGESGEIAEKIKKMIRDDGGTLTLSRRSDLEKELGDVLWYLAAIATEMHVPLEAIAKRNIEKLADRQNRGALRGSGDNR